MSGTNRTNTAGDFAADALMTAKEVAEVMRVNHVTVARWGRRGLLTVVRTPGGIPRYRRDEVMALARGQSAGPGREAEAEAEGDAALAEPAPGEAGERAAGRSCAGSGGES